MAKLICKWCGARVDPVKKSCGRCGRKILPLSDCGGFYDVVPDAPKGGQMPPVESGIRPQVNPMTYSSAPVYQPTGLPGWVKATLGVLAAGVVILGVVALGQSGKIRDLEVQKDNSTLQNEVITEYIEVPVTTPVPDVTEPTEPSETVPTLLEELQIRLSDKEDASAAFVNEQLGNVSKWQDLAKQWTTVENSPWQKAGITNSLDTVVDQYLEQFQEPEKAEDQNKTQNGASTDLTDPAGPDASEEPGLSPTEPETFG